jgi:hypothetical protein
LMAHTVLLDLPARRALRAQREHKARLALLVRQVHRDLTDLMVLGVLRDQLVHKVLLDQLAPRAQREMLVLRESERLERLAHKESRVLLVRRVHRELTAWMVARVKQVRLEPRALRAQRELRERPETQAPLGSDQPGQPVRGVP